MRRLALSMALAAPWLMEEAALVQLLEIAAREHTVTPNALEAHKAQALEKGERASFRDGVAILRVEGPLFKRANLMTEYCGATSYDVLRRDLATAVGDFNVRAIMLAIDSPGGEAAGCAEFAAAVAAVRGKKPIVAYVADVGASAAYWIASACDRIVCGPSAALGSIGVRMSMADTSGRDERSGVRRFEFVSSQSPYKVADPKTEGGAGRLQARVDALAEVFVGTVAANRGVSAARVLDGFGKGDVLIGAAAVAAGMADGLGSFEAVLADLAAEKVAAAARPAIPISKPVTSVAAQPQPAIPLAMREPSAEEIQRANAEREQIEGERAFAMLFEGYRWNMGL